MSFVSELRRRNVFRVGIAYAVLGWLLLQVTDVVVPILVLPDWVAKLVLFLLVLGLPVALFLAWAFELTPEGIKREDEVESGKSITRETGRKLDRTIIAILAIALAWSAWDRFGGQSDDAMQTATAPDSVRGIDKPVIAVLPFQATGSEDGGFLAAGLHDDLLTRLAKLGAFQVISRTSMMEYSGRKLNMRQIGEELGAGFILEGGVQARGGRVRVNAQLIHASDDEHLWAETYDRELTAVDLFDIQAELAVAIADGMRTTLSPEDRSVVDRVPTESLDAYNAYLRGLGVLRQSAWVGNKDDRDAVEAFEDAVRIDPNFALAWAFLATARSRVTGNEFEQGASDAALEALTRARELEPGLLEAELAWAEYLYRMRREYAHALEVLEGLGDRAAGSNYALSLKAYLNRRLGHFEEGYRLLLSVARLEPRNPRAYVDLVHFAIQLNDCAAARDHAATLLLLDPASPSARVRAAQVALECDGDAARAVVLLQDVDLTQVGDIPFIFNAALNAGDGAFFLQLIETFSQNEVTLIDIYEQLSLFAFHTWLEPDPAAAAAVLDRIAALIESTEKDDAAARTADFAAIMQAYSAARGDAGATRYWIEEHWRRYRAEAKGDVSDEGIVRFDNAWDLAFVGLHDAAVDELRVMLEQPGGYLFRFVDTTPVFDVLKNNPGYLELAARFGK